jgi:prephenate dehydrogenase
VKQIVAAICRYFEATAEKRASELVKTYAYDCITPEEHDAVLAFTSRLPQALSIALANTALDTMRLDESGGNCNRVPCGNPPEMTRLAPNDPAIWREILATNGENVRRTLAALQWQIGSLDSPPSEQQIEQIQQSFQTSLISKLA